MQEKGLIIQLYNKWWKSNAACNRDDKKDQKASPLGLSTFRGIFLVLIVGLLFAVVVCIIEFIYYTKKNSDLFKVFYYYQFFNLSFLLYTYKFSETIVY
jgi:hypothetical protein